MSAGLLLEERKYLRDLLRAPSQEPHAVVLVGSWARGTYRSPLSDIDVLVVGESAPLESPPGVQVLHASLDHLRSRVLDGDDFLQWALRFGTPLRGRVLWEKLRAELLPTAPWPEPKVKLEQAGRRFRVAKALFEMGDLDSAGEEARFALSHLARFVLLGRGVFPLSRPELPVQLRAVGDPALASALEALNGADSPSKAELMAALELMEPRLRESEGQQPLE